jgi:hypothetical protein
MGGVGGDMVNFYKQSIILLIKFMSWYFIQGLKVTIASSQNSSVE